MDGAFQQFTRKGDNINKSALTIIELLIATVIALWVVGITIVLFLITQNSAYDINTNLEIQRKANLAMERLLRGFKSASDSAARGILDAKSFTIDNPQKIRIISGIDSKERSFYLENDKLMYDPDTSAGLDEISIIDSVSALTFTDSTDNPGRIVLIDFTVAKSVRGVDKTMNLTGVAVLRND
jgi:type II secretory pathway pseudopilin PulG